VKQACVVAKIRAGETHGAADIRSSHRAIARGRPRECHWTEDGNNVAIRISLKHPPFELSITGITTAEPAGIQAGFKLIVDVAHADRRGQGC
jgi:hypothetical protein